MSKLVTNLQLVVAVLIALTTIAGANLYRTSSDLRVHKAPRWNIPWLGIGIQCNGCPATSCEDDMAIVYGYCCGCAKLLDKLPVLCPQGLNCPLNGAGLCHDYEYMMRCCC